MEWMMRSTADSSRSSSRPWQIFSSRAGRRGRTLRDEMHRLRDNNMQQRQSRTAQPGGGQLMRMSQQNHTG